LADQDSAEADEYCDTLLHGLQITLNKMAPLRTVTGRRLAIGHFTLGIEVRYIP